MNTRTYTLRHVNSTIVNSYKYSNSVITIVSLSIVDSALCILDFKCVYICLT